MHNRGLSMIISSFVILLPCLSKTTKANEKYRQQLHNAALMYLILILTRAVALVQPIWLHCYHCAANSRCDHCPRVVALLIFCPREVRHLTPSHGCFFCHAWVDCPPLDPRPKTDLVSRAAPSRHQFVFSRRPFTAPISCARPQFSASWPQSWIWLPADFTTPPSPRPPRFAFGKQIPGDIKSIGTSPDPLPPFGDRFTPPFTLYTLRRSRPFTCLQYHGYGSIPYLGLLASQQQQPAAATNNDQDRPTSTNIVQHGLHPHSCFSDQQRSTSVRSTTSKDTPYA